tara:strand:+ start:628 stop:849 length:222 start_codon:yes stop_codon:yes gene_type:complete
MARNKRPIDTLRVSPLVKRFFEICHESGDDYSTIADKAGVSKETIIRWQSSNAPSLTTFTACLQVMGYELEIR